MKIIKSKHGGFCFGVKRAVDQALMLSGQNNYVLGEIIHNEFVINKLKSCGVKTIDSIDNHPLKKGDTLLIRTHGEPLKTFERANQLGLNVIDCTCPFVKEIQKIVKKYWPGARAIKAMKSRSEDVNRKTLLLLYIVTGGMSDETYNEIDEYYSGSEEFLEYHCKKMNRMLKECGMSRIDPRNIFDYLVMYCLRPEEEIFMSDRMALLMSEIFEETTL